MEKPENMKSQAISLLTFLSLGFAAAAQEAIPGTTAEAVSPFSEIRLFPNPTSEIIFIRNGDMIDSYQVIDMQGRVVQTGVKNAQVISLIDVPVGYYFIEMKIGETTDRVKVQKY